MRWRGGAQGLSASGGDFGAALQGAAIGAALSGATAGVTAGLSSFAPTGVLPGLGYGAATQGVVGGVTSAISGGGFGSGFASGAIIGGITGGISGLASARAQGRNIWTGGAPDLAQIPSVSRVDFLSQTEITSPKSRVPLGDPSGGYTIDMTRIAESPDATVSSFQAYGPTSRRSVTGYMLEPGGPSTTIRDLDKRIPVGRYTVIPHNTAGYPNTYLIYNGQVPADRGILIHIGNYHSNTSGCILPGCSYGLLNGNYRVLGSAVKLNELRLSLSRGLFVLIRRQCVFGNVKYVNASGAFWSSQAANSGALC